MIRLILGVLFLGLSLSSFGQEKSVDKSALRGEVAGGELRVGFWNVQNLFDTINQSGVNDGQYTPTGKKMWDGVKYYDKLDLLSQVVRRMGLDLLGLCEVENRGVVEDLVLYSGINYKVVHFDSSDPRGIDQAILYDTAKMRLLESGLIRTATEKPKREILQAKFAVAKDTVVFLIVHLPSKLGGEKAEVSRNEIVAQLEELVWRQKHKIVIMGDMNDDPIEVDGMVNCAKKLQTEGKGSYTYKGVAQMLDQILVSQNIKHKNMQVLDNNGISKFNRKKRASDHKPVKINLLINNIN